MMIVLADLRPLDVAPDLETDMYDENTLRLKAPFLYR